MFVLSVCLSVSPLVMNVYSGKITNPVEKMFGMVGWVGLSNDVLDGVQVHPPFEWANFGGGMVLSNESYRDRAVRHRPRKNG